MLAQIYNQLLLVSWVLVLCLGSILIVGSSGRLAQHQDLTTYKRSRRLMGLSFILLALEEFIHWQFNFRLTRPPFATATNITCYHAMAVVMGMSIISLIEHGYISRRQMLRDFGVWFVNTIAVWFFAAHTSGRLQFGLLAVCSAVFGLEALRITIHFFKTYSHASHALDNYYSENMELFTQWLYKSVLFLIFTGLMGSVMAFLSPAAISVHIIIADAMCLYVFMALINYVVNFKDVDVAVVADDEATASNDPISNSLPGEEEAFKARIAEWLDAKHFLNPEITIDQAAKQMGTNRTYLSSYLNNVYNTTFREWINGKRIDYASKLLLNEPALSVADVATQVGFNSSTYFIRQFSKCTGTTPLKWRKTQSS